MVLTSRTPPSLGGGVTGRGGASTAFGITWTGVPPGSRRRTSDAAMRLTAVHVTGARRMPVRAAAQVGTGPIPPQSECTVTTVGTPRRESTPTSGAVNGATTETWACTRSKSSTLIRRPSISERARMTCTGPVSALVSPSAVRGVEVSTVTLAPLRACRCARPAT